MGGGLPTDQPSDWPRLSEVNAYDLRVRQELDRILSDRSQASASRWQYPREIILNVAIEHRLMHAETLAYMLHQLPSERKIAPPSYRPLASSESGPADHCEDDRHPGWNGDARDSARTRIVWLGQ